MCMVASKVLDDVRNILSLRIGTDLLPITCETEIDKVLCVLPPMLHHVSLSLRHAHREPVTAEVANMAETSRPFH
jgi:hypothetical protein